MQKNLDDFYLFGSTNKDLITDDEIKNYKLNQFPLVNGKKTEMTTAITKIKKIIKGRTLHFDGLICDQRSQHSILDLAESLRSSINHCDAEEINNFYAAYQTYGGSLVSFNELKKRADLIIFIGNFDSYILERFSKNLSWSSKKIQSKIYYISTKKISFFKQKITLKGNTSIYNFFINLFKQKKLHVNHQLLQKELKSSRYPVLVINPTNGFMFTQQLLKLTEFINNKIRKLRIFKISGLNNSSGFVNSCVIKTGFPASVSFNDWGLSYNPIKYTANVQKSEKPIQIYTSNLNSNPKIEKFKQNIFIGHPNIIKKEKFDIFIPVKTPGIDSNGMALRSDGIGVLKLEKKIDSNYIQLDELVKELTNND